MCTVFAHSCCPARPIALDRWEKGPRPVKRLAQGHTDVGIRVGQWECCRNPRVPSCPSPRSLPRYLPGISPFTAPHYSGSFLPSQGPSRPAHYLYLIKVYRVIDMRLNKTQTPGCGERSLDNEASPQNTLSGERENGAAGGRLTRHKD